MKYGLSVLILILLSVLLLFGCGKEKNTATPTDATSETTEKIQTDISDEASKATDAYEAADSSSAEETQTEDTEPAKITVCFKDDTDTGFDDCISFSVNESEFETCLCLFTDKEVSNFKFNTLTITDVDDDGNITFDEEQAYSVESFSPEKPIAVNLTFYGDSPEYGISYTDVNGEEVSYTLTISGYDGSPVLAPY